MTRTPVGTTAQSLSRAAVAAHVASRMVGLGSSRAVRDQWLRDTLGLRLRSNGLDRAAANAGGAIRPWLLVDAQALGEDLENVAVVFPGTGRDRSALVAGLRRSAAVRELFITRSRRDVVCVLLFDRRDKDEFFRKIEALGEPFVWEEVLEEDRTLEMGAWTDLARRMGEREGLRVPT